MKKTENIVINIANDFTETPGARFRSDGEYSGEAFYEEKLKPEFNKVWLSDGKLTLNLDGTYGYASSFISEIFNRLIDEYKDKDKILQKIEFISNDDPLLINFIKSLFDNDKKK